MIASKRTVPTKAILVDISRIVTVFNIMIDKKASHSGALPACNARYFSETYFVFQDPFRTLSGMEDDSKRLIRFESVKY